MVTEHSTKIIAPGNDLMPKSGSKSNGAVSNVNFKSKLLSCSETITKLPVLNSVDIKVKISNKRIDKDSLWKSMKPSF